MTETQDWTPASRVRFSFPNGSFNLTIVLLYLILSTSTMIDSLGPMGYGNSNTTLASESPTMTPPEDRIDYLLLEKIGAKAIKPTPRLKHQSDYPKE